jgi:putative DNA primase/helicase
MSKGRDPNDILRQEGPDALRARFDSNIRPFKPPPPEENADEITPATEENIALAYADRHARELRYVAAWSRWQLYDGSRWQFDDTLDAFGRARVICREVSAETGKPQIASAKTVAAIERLARADRRLATTAAQWDSDPYLFNTGGEP